MEAPHGTEIEFEVTRPHLRSVAARMLGPGPEADDAVQEAWLRWRRADTASIDNPVGWLTTTVSRICLDVLRSRRSRREESLTATAPEQMADHGLGPEQEAVLGDAVARALVVVLDRLTPLERVAFVLHDVFGVAFEEIARTVDRTPAAARQLASRARRRMRGADVDGLIDRERQRQVLEAFLRAARRGDLESLLELLAPDVTVQLDPAAAAHGTMPPHLEGATAVASAFSGRAQSATTALVDGDIGAVVHANHEVVLLLSVTIAQGTIHHIEATADPDRLASAAVTILDA